MLLDPSQVPTLATLAALTLASGHEGVTLKGCGEGAKGPESDCPETNAGGREVAAELIRESWEGGRIATM